MTDSTAPEFAETEPALAESEHALAEAGPALPEAESPLAEAEPAPAAAETAPAAAEPAAPEGNPDADDAEFVRAGGQAPTSQAEMPEHERQIRIEFFWLVYKEEWDYLGGFMEDLLADYRRGDIDERTFMGGREGGCDLFKLEAMCSNLSPDNMPDELKEERHKLLDGIEEATFDELMDRSSDDLLRALDSWNLENPIQKTSSFLIHLLQKGIDCVHTVISVYHLSTLGDTVVRRAKDFRRTCMPFASYDLGDPIAGQKFSESVLTAFVVKRAEAYDENRRGVLNFLLEMFPEELCEDYIGHIGEPSNPCWYFAMTSGHTHSYEDGNEEWQILYAATILRRCHIVPEAKLHWLCEMKEWSSALLHLFKLNPEERQRQIFYVEPDDITWLFNWDHRHGEHGFTCLHWCGFNGAPYELFQAIVEAARGAKENIVEKSTLDATGPVSTAFRAHIESSWHLASNFARFNGNSQELNIRIARLLISECPRVLVRTRVRTGELIWMDPRSWRDFNLDENNVAVSDEKHMLCDFVMEESRKEVINPNRGAQFAVLGVMRRLNIMTDEEVQAAYAHDKRVAFFMRCMREPRMQDLIREFISFIGQC